MLAGIYFLLLLMLSVEDYKYLRAGSGGVFAVYVLGIIKIFISKENRWVSVALTCVFFLILFLFYQCVIQVAKKTGRKLSFGGADVRLVPGMMLFQGWEVALTGIFLGLLAAVINFFIRGRKKREIPLIPWMSGGCFLAEIIYLFS